MFRGRSEHDPVSSDMRTRKNRMNRNSGGVAAERPTWRQVARPQAENANNGCSHVQRKCVIVGAAAVDVVPRKQSPRAFACCRMDPEGRARSTDV